MVCDCILRHLTVHLPPRVQTTTCPGALNKKHIKTYGMIGNCEERLFEEIRPAVFRQIAKKPSTFFNISVYCVTR